MITHSCCTILGQEWPGGVYLLRIEVAEVLSVVFGRFQHGQPVRIPCGTYVYIGSAMGQRGANSLARRLLRHTTRSGGKAHHTIRADLLACLLHVHLAPRGMRPPEQKKIFWHVDYLLDYESVALSHAYIVRTQLHLETAVGRLLEAEPGTAILAKGLGASDASGSTHLLRVSGSESWWQHLPTRLQALLEQERMPTRGGFDAVSAGADRGHHAGHLQSDRDREQ